MFKTFACILCCLALLVGAAIVTGKLAGFAARISIWITAFLLMASIGALL